MQSVGRLSSYFNALVRVFAQIYANMCHGRRGKYVPLEQIGLDNIICIHARQDRLLNISNCLMPGERYWGSHYTRLKEIKKVFRAHQCIESFRCWCWNSTGCRKEKWLLNRIDEVQYLLSHPAIWETRYLAKNAECDRRYWTSSILIVTFLRHPISIIWLMRVI